jgi:DNA-binding NtrC family response regulator
MDRMVKLLFIEDEPYVTERVNAILNKYKNIEIIHVDNEKAVREKLETEVYDVIISDVFIYGISVLEINSLAHQKNPDVCVIVITGSSSIDIAEKAVKEKAFDYVVKPPEIEKIDSLIKLYLLTRAENG